MKLIKIEPNPIINHNLPLVEVVLLLLDVVLVLTRKKVAVVGARGYSGLELVRLLLRHPEAQLVACYAHDQVFRLADYLSEPAAALIPVLPLAQFEADLPGLDTIFLATPAEASLKLAPGSVITGDRGCGTGPGSVPPQATNRAINGTSQKSFFMMCSPRSQKK